MAEAERTTSPSAVSRRALLAGGGAILVAAAPQPQEPSTLRRPDPALVLWQRWCKLNAAAEAARIEWQDVEFRLFRTVGFPNVTMEAPDGNSFQVNDHEAIDHLLGTASETRALRRQLHADLAAHQARWDKAAAALRLDDLDKCQDEAYRRAEAISESLFEMPASSLAGVVAKVTLILELGQPSSRDREFPWPQLRSALADLQRLASTPAAFPSAAVTGAPSRHW